MQSKKKKNGQSRDTGNIGHEDTGRRQKQHNTDEQHGPSQKRRMNPCTRDG